MCPGREPSEGCPPSTPSSMWVAEAEEACQDLVTTCARLGHRDSVCISSHLLAAAGIAGGGSTPVCCAAAWPTPSPVYSTCLLPKPLGVFVWEGLCSWGQVGGAVLAAELSWREEAGLGADECQDRLLELLPHSCIPGIGQG